MVAKKKAAKKTAQRSTVKKTSAAKKSTASKKKAAPRKKAAVKKQTRSPAKPKSITARQTKIQILQHIADETELSRKQIGDVFASLGNLIRSHMQKRGSGEFTIPETGVKVRRVTKPARKARMGRNPATGETIKIPAKRASTAIRVTALKLLKEMHQ